MNLTDYASRLLLIGSDASSAKSPALWRPVLAETRPAWTYEPVDVAADSDMAWLHKMLLGSDMIAANVTMPHKIWARQIADHAEPEVLRSGASNLLINRRGRLHAHNTDVVACSQLIGSESFERVLLLGAGGAGRGALESLSEHVGSVVIADRNHQAAEALASSVDGTVSNVESIDWRHVGRTAGSAALVINATPLGKVEHAMPPWGEGALAHDCVLYDFVYAEHVTPAIMYAMDHGLRAVDGWTHLWAQAAAMTDLLGLPSGVRELLKETCTGLSPAAAKGTLAQIKHTDRGATQR